MIRDEAIRILKEHRDELADQFGVQSLSLFGSVARDQTTPISDVDLLVEFNRPVGLFKMFALQDRLEALLGCPVDLGTPNSLKERIRPRVLAEALNVL